MFSCQSEKEIKRLKEKRCQELHSLLKSEIRRAVYKTALFPTLDIHIDAALKINSKEIVSSILRELAEEIIDG